MAEQDTEGTDIYALDNWLRYLGLWKGGTGNGSSYADRKAEVDALLQKPISYQLARSDSDEASELMVSVSSNTTYDPETGEFTDTIKFRRQLPWEEGNESGFDNGQVHVLTIRGELDPRQEDDEIPSIIPSRITVNGSTVFSGYLQGGKDDPLDADKLRLINRLRDISSVCKEVLINKEPLTNFFKNLSDLDKMALGAPALTGIGSDGNFKDDLTGYFMNMVHAGKGGKLCFNAENPDELDVILGFPIDTFNDTIRLQTAFDKTGVHRESGLIFNAQVLKEYNEETDRYIRRLTVKVENPPEGMDIPPPIELARLEFSRPDPDKNEFFIEHANFMDGDATEFDNPRDQTKVAVFLQKSLTYLLAKGKFPPFYNIAYQCRLDQKIQELSPPASHETGGEMLFIPLNGSELEPQVGSFGATLGGGNLFMSRCTKPDGRWSEVGILCDNPLETGGAEMDVTGSQPDFTQFKKQLKQGLHLRSHSHYDHSTDEFAILRGDLKGHTIFTSAEVKDLIKLRAANLGATKDQFPIFIDEDHPDVISYGQKKGGPFYAYPVKDEDDIIRAWVQVCRNGAYHSALTDVYMITECYGDEHYGETHFIYNDAMTLTEQGWKFAEMGPLGLIGLPGVNEEKLREAVPDKEEMYIAYHDPTNITKPGHAPRLDEFKEDERFLMKLVKDVAPDQAMMVVPFSTHHLEIQAFQELTNEPELLRNTTAIGTNMEIRLRLMNKYGVNPDIDLRTETVPAEKIPQGVYDAALYGLKKHLDSMGSGFEKRAQYRKDDKTAIDLQNEDVVYAVLNHVLTEANEAIESGNDKPSILYDALMSSNKNRFEDLAEELGFERKETPRDIPNPVYEKMKEYGAENSTHSGKPEADTTYWTLRNICKHHSLTFENKCSLNEYAMYNALMNEQDTAKLHYTRTSQNAKDFRKDLGQLLLYITGPLGTPEEGFATLSRYANGDSLLDYDPTTRNTGYHLDDTPKIIRITQPPSMGEHARQAQEALIRKIVERRNDMVILSTDGGYKIYNAGELSPKIEEAYKAAGKKIVRDDINQVLRIHDINASHIYGHGFYEDVKNTASRLKAKSHEVIHIPDATSFYKFRDMIQQDLGKKTSITKPQNFVARRPEKDPETGSTVLKAINNLTKRYWQIRERRQYGKQYGGNIDMWLVKVLADHGNENTSGMRVRHEDECGKDYVKENSATYNSTDIRSGTHPDARSRGRSVGGPSRADTRTPGRSRTPGNMGLLKEFMKNKKFTLSQGAPEPNV
jgi:hypothetical protein